MYKPVFFIVEGADDQRFVERVLKPLLLNTYSHVFITAIAHKTMKDKINTIKGAYQTCHGNDGAVWVLIDNDEKPVLTALKNKVKDTLCISDANEILVAFQEIEAWYLAGSARLMRKFKLSKSDHITKQKFEQYSAKEKFSDKYYFILAILDEFSLDEAKLRNDSLNYSLGKIGIAT